MTLETVIRPFVGEQVAPQRFIPTGGNASSPPVQLTIGLVGGSKTFSFSNSSTLSSYMAAVHTEQSVSAFDMTTGKLAQ